MKLNKYLMTGALVALMGIGVVGCNENPTGDDPGTVTNVSALEANALSASSVGLRWTASTTTGASYRVVYGQVDASGVALGTMDTVSGITGTSTTITGLTQVATGGSYRFTVHTVSGTSVSTGASINWAPAERFVNDAAVPSVTLRMYEFASTSGSGLILDPSKGGPRNASVAASSGDPAGSIALAIYTVGITDGFDIGPAYAFIGFRNADKFDSTSYISKDAFSVASLDDLYLRNSLETYIRPGGDSAGNISAFRLPATSSTGVAYAMRVGGPSNRHYARVLVVPDAQGRLLRGVAPDRYVVVQVSYQRAANVPYAKGVVRSESAPAFKSYVPYPLN